MTFGAIWCFIEPRRIGLRQLQDKRNPRAMIAKAVSGSWGITDTIIEDPVRLDNTWRSAENMVAAYVAEMHRLLSVDRLARYGLGILSDLEMVITYHWNIELWQALYPSLCALEVNLRNSIHLALQSQFQRPDWYDMPGLLQRDELKMLNDTKSKIRRTGVPVVHGRVVAGLNFGFWTNLLSGLYGNSPKGPKLWPSPHSSLLALAFPNAPVSHQQFRGRIHLRFDQIRKLRNRVFHYECVFDDPFLLQKHSDIIDAIGWVSPLMQSSTVSLDRFDHVYRYGKRHIRRTLKQDLGFS